MCVQQGHIYLAVYRGDTAQSPAPVSHVLFYSVILALLERDMTPFVSTMSVWCWEQIHNLYKEQMREYTCVCSLLSVWQGSAGA